MLITGASGGIGAALARAHAETGAHLALSGIRQRFRLRLPAARRCGRPPATVTVCRPSVVARVRSRFCGIHRKNRAASGPVV
jgi:NAD(P)-dependent dehydrogenase (short-subunit alcohol dehydrogenase family)